MTSLASLMSLEGRVALVTGASGGIGREICNALGELGCNIALLDRDGQRLGEQEEQLRRTFGISAHGISLDLESEHERVGLRHRLQDHFSRLDILVNNAAFVGDSHLSGWCVPFENQEIETWRRAIEVNLTASFHLSQLLKPLLSESGAGAIVNIGSIYGAVGPDFSLYAGTSMGNPAAYAASKGGLIQLTRWLATVLAPSVRVNCVCPGGVYRGQPLSFVEKYESRTPLARMAKEEDLKGAVAYLASGLSSYVTGQVLFVDGGWTVW